jgi:signal transduction histidine kinase/ActR/RegA family two-component response regulator
VTIRTYLLALVLAAVIPLGAFAAVLLYVISNKQEAEMESAVLESAKALAGAVESNLDSGLKRMQVLANESSLHDGDIPQFAERCEEALNGSPDWRSLLLSARDGTQLVNTLTPPNPLLPSGIGLAYVKQVFDTGKPVISRLFIGRISKQPIVGLAVPVNLGGSVAYVLASGLDLGYLGGLIAKSVGVDGGMAALLDQDLKYITRSRDSAVRVGASAPPEMRQTFSARPTGVGYFRTEEGLDVVGAWARLPQSGWTVWVANPLAAHHATWLRYVAVLAGIWLLVATAGAVAATLLAQRIARDVSELGAEAGSLASGAPVADTNSSIVELRALGDAHQRAGTRLRQLLERERQHRERAEGENKSKDEFLAMLGHELRNPLGAISNAARVLQMQQGDPKMVRFAGEVITRQSSQLRRLIDDLLDVNRIISGKISLETKRVNLMDTVADVVDALQSVASEKNHAVTVQSSPVWVDADPARLEQVLSNLLSNAIAHTPAGGKISVNVAQHGDTAILRVADTGVGIEAEHLDRVFDLFYQAPQSLDRAKGGLGIGLTLVRRLVQLHGGSVDVSSEGPNKGSVFTVRLPAVSGPARMNDERQPPHGPGKQLKVLLIEDDPDSRESLKQVLELGGHSVEVAADGHTGLAKVTQWSPDVAIVDIGLPGMNGYQVANAIRRGNGAEPTLVALTGYGRPEDEQLARRAGFDEHLVKPVDFERLLEILGRRARLSLHSRADQGANVRPPDRGQRAPSSLPE